MKEDIPQIAIMSYGHENATEGYTLESLGEDFELTVPPENVLMAVCAHHQAKELIDQGIDASILTVGGAAESNMNIVLKINELTETNVPVRADRGSNSVASNIQTLKSYENPFIIVCQKFAELRTYIHSKYHLGKENFKTLSWESYIEGTKFSTFESNLLEELKGMSSVPLQRKVVEGVLTALAIIDPKNGGTKFVASVRQHLREKNPEENVFRKTGLH